MGITQFEYIKIQPKTIDLSTRLRGINYRVCGVYSPEPRRCLRFRLNIKISKLGYYADRGQCYLAEADDTLRDLQCSSYHTKAEFNNCFIIHSKHFQSSKNTKCI